MRVYTSCVYIGKLKSQSKSNPESQEIKKGREN